MILNSALCTMRSYRVQYNGNVSLLKKEGRPSRSLFQLEQIANPGCTLRKICFLYYQMPAIALMPPNTLPRRHVPVLTSRAAETRGSANDEAAPE